MTANTARKPIAESEVHFTRVYDAPRGLVFKAWTDPRHMAQWWGPRGFTNPVCELDVRVGGVILIHMRAPDGTVYPMTGTFQEVVEPERLVFIAVARDDDGHALLEGLVTVTFEEHGGKTTLAVHETAVGFAAVAEQMLAGMETGWAQSLERLDALVISES
jgi:uncharacterized protein YndB with AHSA1/START domain